MIKLSELYGHLVPLLRECGIHTQMPVTTRPKMIEKISQELREFADSEAVGIFRQAEKLRPPGVLRRWAEDPLTRDARETRVYIKARRLVRQVWRETVTTRRHFLKETQNVESNRRDRGTRGAGDGKRVHVAECTAEHVPGPQDRHGKA